MDIYLHNCILRRSLNFGIIPLESKSSLAEDVRLSLPIHSEQCKAKRLWCAQSKFKAESVPG